MRRQARIAGDQASPCGGFTLIEVVISSTILAVGLLALAAMQFSAMRGGTQGRHTTAADAAARSQLEQFDRMPWGSLAATGGWVVAPTPVTSTVQATTGNAVEETYNIQWRITDVVANETKNIDVQVSWNERTNGQPKTLTLSTVKYNAPVE